MIENIAFDESGNTGDDLLNIDQKVFALASNNFNNAELQELFSVFNNVGEVHFTDLKNSETGRRQLLSFINHGLISKDNIQISSCNKEFATVAQLVDKIYEPYYNSIGIDLYKDSVNLTLANMIYYLGNTKWHKSKYLNLLFAFVKFIRRQEKENFIGFGEAIDILKPELCKKEIEMFIFPLLQPEYYLDELRSGRDIYSLDFTLSLFLSHCDIWHKLSGKMLAVKFDNSKQIDFYRGYIQWLSSLNVEKVDVGYDHKTMTFPAQIKSLELVDSKNSLSVQCSDILASTIAFYYNNSNKKQELFRKEISESKLFNLDNYFNIWPSATNLNIQYGRNSGLNIIDFLMGHRETFPRQC